MGSRVHARRPEPRLRGQGRRQLGSIPAGTTNAKDDSHHKDTRRRMGPSRFTLRPATALCRAIRVVPGHPRAQCAATWVAGVADSLAGAGGVAVLAKSATAV